MVETNEPYAFLAEAEAVVESASVLAIYAACEWRELDENGKLWVAAIVRETRARAAALPSPEVERLFQPNDDELAAIREIGAEQELSEQAVMRQALRHYQLLHVRMKAGETMSFSGDAERAAEFAALSTSLPSPRVEPITQAHRDAAADAYLIRRFGDGDEESVAASIRAGECDHWDQVRQALSALPPLEDRHEDPRPVDAPAAAS